MAKIFTTRNSDNEPSYRTSHTEFIPLLLKMDRVLSTRGPKGLIEYIKPIRVQFLAYLSGSSERSKGVRTTKDGIPICLGVLVERIRESGSPEIIEKSILPFLSTIFWSTRALKPDVKEDISTIKAPPRGNTAVVLSAYRKYLIDFWKTMGYRKGKTVPKSLKFRSYHFTTKSGPNGHALGHYLDDLELLPDSLRDSISEVGGELLAERMRVLLKYKQVLRDHGHLPPMKGKGSIRKLVSFPDMEGKKRIVAELDYFSQTSLKPLHLWLFRLLRRIPQDRTFDQGGFVKTFDTSTEDLYSVDLTAATDRFPMEFISFVLSGVLPEKYVTSWKDIMVGYPFNFRGRKISYATGNPMGAYSSWASFTVAHHFVVYCCCRELKIDWKNYNYHLLGDDIVLSDSRVGELYMKILTDLGVEYSPMKTHKSKILFEFAKRYFYKGGSSRFWEISPFPVSALRQVSKRSYLLTQLLMSHSGWVAPSVPLAVKEYYSIVKHYSARNCRRMYNNSVLCEQITKVIAGSIAASDSLDIISRCFGLQVIPRYPDKFYSSVAQELFTESDPRRRSNFDLGELAFNLVIALTAIEFTYPDTADTVISAEPILFCYGKVEEWYLNLLRQAKGIWDVGENWPLILRSFALPSDDNIFTQSQRDHKTLAAYLIGKKILARFDPKRINSEKSEWLRWRVTQGNGFTMWDRTTL